MIGRRLIYASVKEGADKEVCQVEIDEGVGEKCSVSATYLIIALVNNYAAKSDSKRFTFKQTEREGPTRDRR